MLLALSLLAATAASEPAQLSAGDATAHLRGLTHAGFEVDATALPWVGGDRVRLQPTVDGLRVLGAQVVVAMTPDGPVVHGEIPRWRPASQRFVADEARALSAAAALARDAGLAWAPTAEAGWRVVEGSLAPAWVVSLARMNPFVEWRVLVDGVSGEVLAATPVSWTVDPEAPESPAADIYPQNPLNSELTRVTLSAMRDDELKNRAVDIWSCDTSGPGGQSAGACPRLTRHATPDASGDFLFDPDPAEVVDPFAEVQLYHHLDFMAGWLSDRWGLSWPWPIQGFVNFETTNAFYGDYNGDGRPDVSFGQSPDGVDFGYDADVIYHELGHGVVDAVTAGGYVGADTYGMDWAPGALNEGTADVFAMLLTGDPDLAEYAGSFDGRDRPIRELDADRTCPESLAGEVHYDGEVWGALFWNLQEQLGADKTAELLWGAITTWDAPPTWSSAGSSVLQSAKALRSVGFLDDGELDRVDAELTASGLHPDGDGCATRVISLDDGEPVLQIGVNLGLTGDFGEVSLGSQFSLTVPERGSALRLQLTANSEDEDVNDFGWTVYTRRGAPIEHEVQDYASLGIAFAIPDEYDDAFESDTSELLVEITEDLTPGERWYFAVATRNLGDLEPVAINAIWVAIDSEVERRVSLKEEPSCSCASTRPTPFSLAALLPLTMLLYRRSD